MSASASALTLTVPRTLDDLARHWQGFIARELARKGRTKFNASDVLGYVMLKLCESNVVAKFWAGSQSGENHPLTVTAEEAAGMLGITFPEFLAFQVESDDSLDPCDMGGRMIPDGVGYTSPKARYLFADVVALSASVTFPNQGTQVFPTPKEPTVAQWRAYLSRAVSNHSANYVRSWRRHESKEHLADSFAQFRDPETVKVEFEARLVDEEAQDAIEQTFDVASLLKRAPGLQTRKTEEGMNFFALLGKGYTIREASKMVRLTRREVQVVAAFVGE